MDEILKMLVAGKKASLTFFICLSCFLGYQYAEFKWRLTRIEDRLLTLEVSKELKKPVAYNKP
jgi:hypothetical protein